LKKFLVIACASVILAGCMGIPFMRVDVQITPDSPVLAERPVPVQGNHDVVELAANDGSFTALVFQVQGNDIEISNCIVTYDNGEQERIPGRLVFQKDARSHSFPLHNRGRHRIKTVEYTYRIIGESTNSDARVAVYGVR
jgi:hypothetical protein